MPEYNAGEMDPLGIEFLKDRYDFELERKDQLTEALTLPVGVLTVLGSVLGVLAQYFNYGDDLPTYVFLIVLVVDVVAFTVCLCYLARAYHAQSYAYLPTLRSLADAKRDLIEYYEMSEEGTEAQALKDFAHSLEERIIEAADANTQNNDRRSSLLHRSRIALFAVLVLTALAGVPFVASQLRVDMPEAPKPAAPARPGVTTPQKPAFPQNRIVREGANVPPSKIQGK